MQIKKESVVPLYYQIAEDIKRQILNSELQSGDKLPTEFELQKKYGVSSPTVKKAVQFLNKDGFIVKERGKTPYVTRTKFEHSISVAGFTEEMLLRGLVPSTKIISLCHRKPTTTVAEYLQIKKDEDVIFLKRLRFANGAQVSLNTSYIPKRFAPDLVKKGLRGESLYQCLEENYGLNLYEIDETVEAILAKKQNAKLLNIKEGSPLLLAHRKVYDKEGFPIEYSLTIFRGDKFKYHAKGIRCCSKIYK